jgi:soluble lytic murein transglycosylase
MSTDELGVARQFALWNVEDRRKSKALGNSDWIVFLSDLERLGDYQNIFSYVMALPAENRIQVTRLHPGFLFPRPYLPTVEAAAEKFGVKPELIYSIMRQESSFNPEARSPMDALGLMQVMPTIATEHAQKNNITLKHPEDLFVPELNIPVGAAVLRSAMDLYKGQFILAVASYNANDAAIRNWLKTRLGEDPLEFIEDIPYLETRTYVKLVMRNLIFYSRLVNPETNTVFPEWCLAHLQDFKS